MATQPDYMPEDEPLDSGAMSEEELASLLGEHETRAIGYFESDIASDQAEALKRYYRRPYGDERPGRSKVVDGTVAITVDNALAAILKPFVSSDETVTFEPRSKEDEEQAQQATEYVNYVLHQDNCGFQVLHDWFKDSLLQKLGVIKCYWEDKTHPKPTRLERLDPMQLQMIMAEEQVIDGPYGPDEDGLFTIDILRSEPDGKLCVENIPPEEYRISPLARPGRIAPYEAHCTQKARSELVELGFDPELVDSLAQSSRGYSDSRELARREDEGFESDQGQVGGDKSRELVDFNDEYALIDFDGDGVSELRHVIRSGNVILFNEEAEYSPFARLCPVPMPHKVYGLSLADLVLDEQRIGTALWRQTLDNLYLSNNPRPVVGQQAERDDGSTIDDIMSDAPGAIIRAKDASQLGDFSVPFVADKSFPMLAYVEQQAESRTGISKQGQGMDPSAIDSAGQISATQAAIMEEGRNSRAEMIARIFAETGVKDLFKIMLKMLVQHQPRARMVRLRNKWVEMDPRHWNANMDVAISVGLGLGNKQETMMASRLVLETMERLEMSPYASLNDKEKVYNAVKKLYTAAGIKNTDDYVAEPQRDEQGNLIPDEPQPDPAMAEMQAKMQLEHTKMMLKAQSDQAEAERRMAETFQKIQLENAKAESKAQLEQARAHYEAINAEQRRRFEEMMALREQAFEEMMAQRDAMRRDKESEAKATEISKNRSGGDLDK